jgi:hypothetical protein
MMAQMVQSAFTIGAAFFIAVIFMSISGRRL